MIGQSTTCASSVGQAAALVALTSDQTCIAEAAAMYRSRRDRMLELLSEESGLDLVAPAGAFYLYVSVAALPGRSVESRVGQECVSKCRSRGSTDRIKNKVTRQNMSPRS